MARSWEDLRARVLSGFAMVAIGVFAIWQGGAFWQLIVSAVLGGMIWELTRMSTRAIPVDPMGLGAITASGFLVSTYMDGPMHYVALGLPALGILMAFFRNWRSLAYAAMILVAGISLLQLRENAGVAWIIWLVLIVVTTDVAGYFAGRAFGGPKFWPRISPKKTWSGTVAGWIGAAVVGTAFVPEGFGGIGIIVLCVIVSFASQMGDIAESALKRRAGVKDSSNLIPGHGGLLDRFDGMLGAAVFVFLFGPLVGLPIGMP